MRTAIVIPTFNRAGLVEQAVESALAQTVPVEVVVVDDGSTDGTKEHLSRFGSRIQLHAQENAERGVARNRGADLVPSAEFLIFLDADDVLEPEHAATLLALARAHPQAGLLAARAWETDADLAPLAVLPGRPNRWVTLDDFLRGREPFGIGFLGVRRRTFNAIGGFSEDRALAGSEDWLFVARALALGPAYRGEAVTLRIRKHPGNSMANAHSMHRSALLAHEHLFGPETLSDLRPPAHLEGFSRGDLLVRASVAYYAAGEMGAARRTLLEGVRAAPGLLVRPLPWWTWLRTLLGSRLTNALRRWKRSAQRALGSPKGG